MQVRKTACSSEEGENSSVEYPFPFSSYTGSSDL